MKKTVVYCSLLLLALGCSQVETADVAEIQSVELPALMPVLKVVTDTVCGFVGGQSYTDAELNGAKTFMGEIWKAPEFIKSTANILNSTSKGMVTNEILRNSSSAALSYMNTPHGKAMVAKLAKVVPPSAVGELLKKASVLKSAEKFLITKMQWRLPPTLGAALTEGAVSYVGMRVGCDALRAGVAFVDLTMAKNQNNSTAAIIDNWEQKTCVRLIELERNGELNGKLPGFCSRYRVDSAESSADRSSVTSK